MLMGLLLLSNIGYLIKRSWTKERMEIHNITHSVGMKILELILIEIMVLIGKKQIKKIKPSYVVIFGQERKLSPNQKVALWEIM